MLFTTTTGTTGETRWDESEIVVQSLVSGERKLIWTGGRDARYVSTGHLVYALGDVLFAVPLDLSALEATGGAVAVVQGVELAVPTAVATGSAQFDISEEGTFVHAVGAGLLLDDRLAWIDTQGAVTPLLDPIADYYWPGLSPDGERVSVIVVEDGVGNVWIYDIRTGTGSPLTNDSQYKNAPIWTPDGEHITFQYGNDIYWRPADGSTPQELLWDGEHPVAPHSWSQNGRFLAFGENHPDTLSDIWVFSLEDGTAQPFRNTGIREVNPRFSPDGRWISYSQAAADQEWQVWVAPYPGPGVPYQISTEASLPIWSTDGRTLFFRGSGENFQQIFASAIQTEPAFSRSDPELLFEVDRPFRIGNVHPDGERFVISQAIDSGFGALHINVVQNWFEELKERVPVP